VSDYVRTAPTPRICSLRNFREPMRGRNNASFCVSASPSRPIRVVTGSVPRGDTNASLSRLHSALDKPHHGFRGYFLPPLIPYRMKACCYQATDRSSQSSGMCIALTSSRNLRCPCQKEGVWAISARSEPQRTPCNSRPDLPEQNRNRSAWRTHASVTS